MCLPQSSESSPSRLVQDPVATCDLTKASTESLRVLCENGLPAACAELDRRGIEVPMLESGPEPMAQGFDIAQENAPNPAWMREFAGTLSGEAQLLQGHFDTFAEIAEGASGEVGIIARRKAAACMHSAAALSIASQSLLITAARMEDADGREALETAEVEGARL